MATFGHTTDDSEGNYDSTWIVGCKFTCPEAGIPVKITEKVKNDSGSNRLCKCAIYRVSDNALIAYSNPVTIPNGFDGWMDYPLSNVLSNLENAQYYLVWWDDGVLRHYYRITGMGNNVYGQSRSFDSFPNPWSPSGPYNGEYLIYCTYTPVTSIKTWSALLNTSHVFQRPSRSFKLAQTLNLTHVLTRSRFMRLTQALETLHAWTVTVPGVILKQWFATLQTTHVFRRPVRIIKLPATLQLTHVFNRPTRFMKLVEQVTLRHAYFVAVPSVKKTKLFLVVGDLAIQLSGD